MIIFKIHSVVDVITNSSTVIFTYQDNSVNPAKDLINEMLKLSGEIDKTADDIFYFDVFCDDDCYYNAIDNKHPEDFPNFDNIQYGTNEYKKSVELRNNKLNELKESIIKGEIKKPGWMKEAEEGSDDWWSPDSYLTFIPKEEKYKEFGNKISILLNSISADGGRDG